MLFDTAGSGPRRARRRISVDIRNLQHAVAVKRERRMHPAAKRLALCGLLLPALFCVGCTKCFTCCNRPIVSSRVMERMGTGLGPAACPGEMVLPNGASWEDGLLEDEAVLIALWNNAAFQELLVECKIANADLVQAGLLPNPEAIYFWPVSGKTFKYAAEFPLEALWLRPIRIKAAQRETARVSQRLTQAALDLIRDVRQAYADVELADGRIRAAEEAVRLRDDTSALAEARLT